MNSGIRLLLDSARGIYIPRDFVTAYCGWTGINLEDEKLLAKGPEEEWYWEAWENVLNNAEYLAPDGNVYRLWQDGDLFMYCDELMSDSEYREFFGEDRC